MATKSSKQTETKSVQKPVEQTPPIPIRANINWVNQKEDGNVRATASLNIGGAFAVHGIKIISGARATLFPCPRINLVITIRISSMR